MVTVTCPIHPLCPHPVTVCARACVVRTPYRPAALAACIVGGAPLLRSTPPLRDRHKTPAAHAPPWRKPRVRNRWVAGTLFSVCLVFVCMRRCP